MNARYQYKFVMQFFYGKRRPLSRKRFRKWRRQQRRNAQRIREALAPITTYVSPHGNVFRQAMLTNRGITTNQ